MIRYVFLAFGLSAVVIMLVAGKRGDMSRRPPIEVFPDMDRQPKLRPQTVSDYYADGQSSQLPVAGTIPHGARGEQYSDSVYADTPKNTGKVAGTTNFVETIPMAVTQQFMDRGQERFQINCQPCHGPQGDGKGITTKFGMTVIADLHDSAGRKVVQQPDGQIFNTISYGKGMMGGYAANLTVEDRWAIVAYVRALQRSHLATLQDVPADVPPEVRANLNKAAAPAAAPAPTK